MGEFKLFNWETNPFTFKITPNLFVGYESEIRKIINSIKDGEKFTLITGPTGSGKTTMMKYIINKLSDSNRVIYLPKPPKDPDDFIKIFSEVTKGFFDFAKKDQTNLYNLSSKVNKKLKNRRCVLFVDECHETNVDSLEWLRTITDQIDNISTVLAGLPVIEDMLKDKLETFSRRIVNKVQLTNLSKHEVREMIKKRIENNGGEDIKPFTSDSIEIIFEKMGGFPRDTLKMCNELVREAAEKNITTIDVDFVSEKGKGEPKIVTMEAIEELPDRQKEIIKVMGNKEMTPAEIVLAIKSDSYKNRDNAVRSVNNLLRRLMNDEIVKRKKVGKTYKYVVTGKYETLMVKA